MADIYPLYQQDFTIPQTAGLPFNALLLAAAGLLKDLRK
jgi:hypothetical protein